MFIQITDSMDKKILINSGHIVKIRQAEIKELNMTYIYLSDNSTIQAKCSYDDLYEAIKKCYENTRNFYKL